MSAAEREDVPRPSAVPAGPLSMQALLASCAAANAVSTPPRRREAGAGRDVEPAGPPPAAAAPESEAA
ncbi:hypothetical protein [Streptomyces sp. WAC06614]|uniref:hypothetical protein n=1 Tax=Streptomyces sp. WAC06614 TaxID=2487416 RepID=UPI000F7832AE|nr:hypothetical protein [Streptomyces sp. WAC06614]RSS74721.1 hypothetical protein EF918_24655 [Streptomyces sp. WAC06614]